MTGPERVLRFLSSGWGRALQIAVTLACVAWLCLEFDRQTFRALLDTRPSVFIGALALFSSAQIFGGLRLALLIPGAPPWNVAMRATWIGYFWSNFLPGTLGGDFIRGYRLNRAGIALPTAIGALVTDRLANLAALSLIIGATAWKLGSLAVVPVNARLATGVAFALGILVLCAGIAFHRRGWFGHFLAGTLEPARALRTSPIRLAGVAMLSFLNLGVAIAALAWLAHGLGIDIDLISLAAIIALVTAVTLLPISVNGLGIQEAGLTGLLIAAGAPAALALSFALLARLLIVGASLIAGGVMLYDRVTSPTPHETSQ